MNSAIPSLEVTLNILALSTIREKQGWVADGPEITIFWGRNVNVQHCMYMVRLEL